MKASAILGVFGGVAGVYVSLYFARNPFASDRALSGLDIGIQVLNIAILPALVGAVMAIIGGVCLCSERKRVEPSS